MKYLLRKKNSSELLHRKKYIEKITGVWFFANGEIGDFIILESMPNSYYADICIVYGHNNEVTELLSFNIETLKEKNLFLISCSLRNKKLLHIKNKAIFLAPQSNNSLMLLKGKEFGFPFDITETELNLYNSPEKDLYQKLRNCFSIPNTIL
ncbi:MAG: hypothetical protein ACI4KD_01495 [Oscillospiraceae bacterium]